MRELHPGPGYVGALVAQGAGWRPLLLDFDLPPHDQNLSE
jgi:hypothetical protein